MVQKDYVVIEQMSTTKGKLIGQLTKQQKFAIVGDKFAIKFSLTNSFKVPNGNFVVDNFKIEICAIDINGKYQDTVVADKVKITKREVTKKKVVKKKELEVKDEVKTISAF